MSALRLVAIICFLCGPAFCPAATLQFTLISLAPEGSLALAPTLLDLPPAEIEAVIHTAVPDGGMEVLPALELLAGAASGAFPSLSGGAPLPELLPGESLAFSLTGLDPLLHGMFHLGSDPYAAVTLFDGAGVFTPVDVIITAAGIAGFADDGTGLMRLVLPGSPEPGPEAIRPETALLRLVVVPEPAGAALVFSAILLAGRRLRR